MTVAELQILVDKLQSKISQLELTSKGAIKATEFRLEAVLQANLDTFWLLVCAILVFLMQGSCRSWHVGGITELDKSCCVDISYNENALKIDRQTDSSKSGGQKSMVTFC